MRWRGRTTELYRDRTDAGQQLAAQLAQEIEFGSNGSDVVVLALPRGGVPVAAPLAHRFGVKMSILLVRKIGAPGRPELAMGAVAAIGDRVELFRNEAIVRSLGVSEQSFAAIQRREVTELAARAERFGATPELSGRNVILVDDGLATGATMLAAVQVVTGAAPQSVTVAVPVAARQAVALLRSHARVVCPRTPEPFIAVGQAYDDFRQVSDAEVEQLMSGG
jgi:putative phosphoribosyl transferase